MVVENNPTKPLSQILRRPDVKEALTWPFARAGGETIAAVREAWLEAAGDLVLPEEDLKAVLDNVKQNTVTAPKRLKQAITKGPRDQMADRLTKLSNDLIRRAEFAVEFSGKRAEMLAQLVGSGEATQKTWKRDPASKSCKWCIKLDSTTVGINDIFPLEGWDPFRPLLGPPLHPRCGCRLEIS